MADSKKNTTKYKFGLRELNMLDYLENIGYNVLSYLEDRRKNRGWTDDQVQEFSTAYNRLMDAYKQLLATGSNRFSTTDLGDIVDSQGEFTNIDNDDIDPNGSQYYYNDKGERITTDDYNTLKDKKKKKFKTFNANRLVAEYFRTIGNKMKDAPKKETEKFDLSKHGFVSWWNLKFNPSGGKVNLKPFLDKDPLGTDGKRPVSARAKLAAGWMNEYLDWLKDKDLDYSNYEQFKDYDTYANQGRALAQKWNDNNWDADDLIAGQAFGISNDFSEGFFSTEEDPDLTPEQREAKAAETKQKEEQAKAEQITKNKQAWIDQQIAAFNNSNPTWTQENPYSSTFDRSYWYNDDGSLNQENYYSAWGKNFMNQQTGKLDAGILDSYMNGFVQNPFNAKYKNDIARNIVGLIQTGAAQQISGGDLEGMYYIPSKSDEQHNRALVFDPNTRSLFYTFIGNVPSQWKRRTDKWNLDNGISQPGSKYMFEEGGVIEIMQLGGNFGNSFIEGRNAYVKSKADAQGLTQEQYEARNRKPRGEKNALEQNNGFSANDVLRLTAIGTDLAAMGLSFTPAVGASAITGAAGTTQHLIADIAEDGPDWGDAGRALLGYSLDALGVIPGVSGVTKPIKIAKTLAKYAPRLIAAVGTVGTLANAPAIITSLKKLTTDEHLTVQDWLNVTSALTLAVGGGAAAARKYHTVKGNANYTINPIKVREAVTGKAPSLAGRNTDTGKFAIQVRKKGTNDIENIILTKAESEAVKGKSNDEILKIIQLRPGMDDYELATSQSLLPSVGFRENGKWKLSAGFREKAAVLMPIKRDQRTGRLYAENGTWGADIDKSQMHGVSRGEIAVRQQRRADDAEIANLDVIKNAQRASAKHERRLANKDALVTYQEGKLNTAQAARDAYVAAHPSAPSVANTRAKLLAMADALAGRTGAATRRTPELTGYTAKQTAADDILLGKADRKIGRELGKLRRELADLQSKLGRAVGRNRTRIKDEIAAKQQEIVDKTTERAKLKTDNLDAKDWLTRNNPTEYTNLRQQLAEALRYERGLIPHDTNVAAAAAALGKVKGITDTKGQTEAFKKLKDMMDPSSSTIDFTIGPAGALRTVKRNWEDILRTYGIKYEQGGKFTAVRKYQLGNPIRNVKSKANWFDNMYSHTSMKEWLKRWTPQEEGEYSYKNFNELQDRWYNNLISTGYNPEKPDQAMGIGNSQSQDVYNRQKDWNKTGTNAAIEDAVSKGLITRNGGTADNPKGNYLDGYFGALEYLRHGGTGDSWYGHDEDLAALREEFKSKGLEYYQDPDNGMYKLRPLSKGEVPQNINNSQGNNGTILQHEEDTGDNKTNNTKSIFDTVRKFNIDPQYLSIANNLYANAVNDKMTDRSIDAARKSLTLYDLKDTTKYLLGDFDALMAGELAAGLIYNLASQPITSDGAIQTSAYLDSAIKAQDYIRQGRTVNNQALKKSRDELWAIRQKDSDFNYDVAMKNRQSIGDLIDNIANLRNARDAKRYANDTTLFQELMYPLKLKANKREALEEQFALSDIKNAVKYNLKEYVQDIPDEELDVWNQIVSGNVQYSELDKDKLKLYLKAALKAAMAEQNAMRGYYGIAPSKFKISRTLSQLDDFSGYRPSPSVASSKKGGTITLKDGSRVAVAKIRERSKDADRFYKTTKDRHDRIDKAIARVDKKMYRRRDPEKRRK